MHRPLLRSVVKALALDGVIDRDLCDELLGELDALQGSSGRAEAYTSTCPTCGSPLVLHKSGQLLPAPAIVR